jgi:hypothetical protein
MQSINENECPICMDDIHMGQKNVVTTECGHMFHCSCLMQNVSHNGFNCPYCRTVMAEEPPIEDDHDDYTDYDEYEIFDDDALTSFRMFHQRNTGEDVEEELEAEEDEAVEDQQELTNAPNLETIVEQLTTRGVTFEDLVKCVLWEDQDDFLIEREVERGQYHRTYCEVYGDLRSILNNYRRIRTRAGR